MSDDDTMIDEFKIEAAEMFENAEDGLLNIDKGLDFISNFNSIFRSFHSLKGAAGMFGLESLQGHMHKLESLFEAQKKIGSLKKHQVDYFLAGVDAGRTLLDSGSSGFVHISFEDFNAEEKVATSVVEVKEVKDVSVKLDRKNGVIFIVDDEPDIVEILSEIVSVNDYVIHKFYNGQDAVDSFEKLKPDAILSDLMMPKLNGLEMLKAIYNFGTNVPIIFISGNLSKEKMQEALLYGSFAFIDKPFNTVEILNICRNAVSKSQSMALLEKSINFILYQFSDLDGYLKSQGKENIRITLKSELETILAQRKILKKIR